MLAGVLGEDAHRLDAAAGVEGVLACRFSTVQDYRTPAWGKSILRNVARIRYASGRYDNPWELAGRRRLIPLREPQKESL